MDEAEKFAQLRELIAAMQSLECDLEDVFESWPENGDLKDQALAYTARHLPLHAVRFQDISTSHVGTQWAIELIDSVAKATNNRRHPASFARICIKLFPRWFEFNSHAFSVHSWERGLKLIVSSPNGSTLVLTTSDSRRLRCTVFIKHMHIYDEVLIELHYDEPFVEQRNNARGIFALAFHHLFEKPGPAPVPAEAMIPKGKIFPQDRLR